MRDPVGGGFGVRLVLLGRVPLGLVLDLVQAFLCSSKGLRDFVGRWSTGEVRPIGFHFPCVLRRFKGGHSEIEVKLK